MALGRLLNRFGKDFEQIDAQLPDHLGKTIVSCSNLTFLYHVELIIFPDVYPGRFDNARNRFIRVANFHSSICYLMPSILLVSRSSQ